jgi:hypothetical protein
VIAEIAFIAVIAEIAVIAVIAVIAEIAVIAVIAMIAVIAEIALIAMIAVIAVIAEIALIAVIAEIAVIAKVAEIAVIAVIAEIAVIAVIAEIAVIAKVAEIAVIAVIAEIAVMPNNPIIEITEREKEDEKMYDEYEPTKKASLFEMAEKTVKVDRKKDYGSPAALCEHIAGMWNAYLGFPEDRKITPEQVPFMMVLFKMARESFKHKEDNLVDMIGYVGVADMVRRGE